MPSMAVALRLKSPPDWAEWFQIWRHQVARI